MFRPNTSNKAFKKSFLVNYNKLNINQSELKIGNFGIKSLGVGLLKPNHLESLRRTLKREIKKHDLKCSFWFNVFPHYSYTEKPVEVRMGKGKGNISFYYFPVKKGIIILELQCSNSGYALKILKLCLTKLPFKSKIVKKIC